MNQRPVLALVYEAIYPYSHGGRELRYQELLPRLAERAEVHVYTMHWWDGPRVYRDGAITYHAISKVLPMYTKNRRSIRQALHFGLASLYLLRCHFDVLEADQFPFFHLFILRVVAMLKRKPMTVSWHEFWGRSYWCEYLGWAGWGASIVEWLALRLPDHIITSSPETTERLRRTLGERAQITTVPPGIDFRTICSTSPAAVHSDI